MTTLKPQRAPGGTLAAWAWAAVALTPVGWFYGALAAAYSHLGDVVDVNQMITGVLLFVAAPSSAFILAVHAARAGHRSGKIAVIAAGLLLLATIVVTLLYGGWIGLAVTAVVAVLVLAWVRSRRIAVAVSGLVLLAALIFGAWQSGGWINVAHDHRDGGGRGTGFRLGALPQQAAARAGRCAARGGIARGYCAARRICTDFAVLTTVSGCFG